LLPSSSAFDQGLLTVSGNSVQLTDASEFSDDDDDNGRRWPSWLSVRVGGKPSLAAASLRRRNQTSPQTSAFFSRVAITAAAVIALRR
jgi:hypothetical protein